MKTILAAAALSAAILGPAAAHASDQSDRLGQCLVENASPKDQAVLVRWMFSAMSANPLLKTMASLDDAQREEINKAMAALFERLMLQDCRQELVAAVKVDGQKAVASAFETLGSRAATQLLSDPASTAEVGKMANYVDQEKFDALIKSAQPPK